MEALVFYNTTVNKLFYWLYFTGNLMQMLKFEQNSIVPFVIEPKIYLLWGKNKNRLSIWKTEKLRRLSNLLF